MTPEGRVKQKVKAAIKKLGDECWQFMPVQTGFGSPALDFLFCIRGRFVAIETKAPGKKLTPLQEGTKASIEAAGGIVLVVWDEDTLAIAMKIILALEFSSGPIQHLPVNIGPTGPGGPAYAQYFKLPQPANAETARRHPRYVETFDVTFSSDETACWHHGASAGEPERQPQPSACRHHQAVTVTVTATDGRQGATGTTKTRHMQTRT